MTLEFGTDGIRGVANQELTPELSLALGRAAAFVFGVERPFVVGRDPRISGPVIQAALSAGLASAGADVIDLGVLPTPGVAYISATREVPAAMISASHNPFGDNGIKFFLAGGRKLSDAIEKKLQVELRLLMSTGEGNAVRAIGRDVGSITADPDALVQYQRHLARVLEANDLAGLHVVLDCANGASSDVAPDVFTGLGARVSVLNDAPNGRNINDGCGSTHPQMLQREVVALGADFGLAFDGDADRALGVDEKGALVDGDEIIAMLAIDAKAQGRLKDDTVVVTVMSNLGLRLAMERSAIKVHETKVGDRHVLEALHDHQWSLGGEQSGHVIFPDVASTGDGVLTGLRLASFSKRAGRPLSQLAAQAMTKLPQVLANVRIHDLGGLENASEVWDEVRFVESELGRSGRVLVRPSGTELLVRVMIEAPTLEQAQAACLRLCNVVERVLK